MSIKKSCALIFLVLLGIFSWAHHSQAITSAELIQKYQNALKTGNKVNVLIVPGHDDDYWGTQFGDIREADIAVSLGQYLYNYLKNDPRLNVVISRTQTGYNPIFQSYFQNNTQAIQDFITTSRGVQQSKIASGEIKTIDNVPHQTVNSEIALRLYGINRWANENNIDMTIHLHVDDYGGRPAGTIGNYTGFTVYIPDNQYQNAGASAILGQALFNELKLKNSVSTYPPESKGLVGDQDLIAIGASNTVRNAVALVEYGYIYEPQFRNLDVQETVTQNLAYQTYLGIHRMFGDRTTYAKRTPAPAPIVLSSADYLPYVWNTDLTIGSIGQDVSALQAALTKSGVYSCGITGTFGPCTVKGVKAFQKKYKISQTGVIGPTTRTQLNSLFSSQ